MVNSSWSVALRWATEGNPWNIHWTSRGVFALGYLALAGSALAFSLFYYLVRWVGVTEDDAKARGLKVKKSVFPWNASGRAIANGRDEGFTKLIFDEETHQIVGGGIVGMNAGDMIGEVAVAIEMGSDAGDIAHTIHPHPTLGETMGLAAEVFEGACTDLPPRTR